MKTALYKPGDKVKHVGLPTVYVIENVYKDLIRGTPLYHISLEQDRQIDQWDVPEGSLSRA